MIDSLYLSLVGSLLLLVGCGNPDGPSFTVEERDGVRHAINRGKTVWSDTAAAPIAFAREQTYGTKDGPKKTLLGSIADIAVGNEGTVYVLDEDAPGLIAFASDGRVKWSVERAGKGPGEFSNPASLVKGPAGRLFVANEGGRWIDVWTTKGTFVKRHTFDDSDVRFFSPVGFIGGRLVGTEPFPPEGTQLIRIIDPETGALSRTFPLDLSLNLPVPPSAAVTIIDDQIVASGVAEYSIHQYAPSGTLKTRITRDTEYPQGLAQAKADDGRTMYSQYGELRAPVQLPTGHLLVGATHATNVDNPDAYLQRALNDNEEKLSLAVVLDLFEPNGRHLGSLRWEDRRTSPIGEVQTVGPNDRLYTVTERPFPHVRAYRVTIENR